MFWVIFTGSDMILDSRVLWYMLSRSGSPSHGNLVSDTPNACASTLDSSDLLHIVLLVGSLV